MPKPVFVICSLHALENKDTGLFSIVEIIEKMAYAPVPQPPPGQVLFIPWQTFKATAVWTLSPDEIADAEYETDWRIIMPSGDPIPDLPGPMRVKFSPSRPFSRNVANFMTPLPITCPGTLRVISRMRRVGDEAWTSQEYAIIVEQAPSPEIPKPPVSNGQAAAG